MISPLAILQAVHTGGTGRIFAADGHQARRAEAVVALHLPDGMSRADDGFNGERISTAHLSPTVASGRTIATLALHASVVGVVFFLGVREVFLAGAYHAGGVFFRGGGPGFTVFQAATIIRTTLGRNFSTGLVAGIHRERVDEATIRLDLALLDCAGNTRRIIPRKRSCPRGKVRVGGRIWPWVRPPLFFPFAFLVTELDLD